MNEDRWFVGFFFGSMIVLGLILAIVLWNSSPWGCDARWPDNQTTWSIGTGCLVETSQGFVPEHSYRVIE